MESLRKVRLHFDFARADRPTRGTAKRREEIRGGVAIGDLHRPRSQRQTGELVLGVGDRRHHVEQHLAAHPPQQRMREIPFVCDIALVCLGGELIGPGGADVSDELLEVVLIFHKPLRELIEQLHVHRRIADADVVHIVDKPGTEEVGPDNIDEVSREITVFGRRQPGGRHLTAVLTGDIGEFAAEELGRHDPPADRMLDVAAARVKDNRFAAVLARLTADLGKEVGEAVVVVHRPTIEWMVVALGALDPHSQEHLRHIFCHLQRVGFVLVVVGGRIAERASLAREKFAKELVDWHISLDPLLQPVVVEQHRLVGDLGRGADHQQFRPLHHPHLDEFLPLEQAIHEVLALGGVGALQK